MRQAKEKDNFGVVILLIMVVLLGVLLGSLLLRSRWSENFNYTVVLAGGRSLALLSIDPIGKKGVLLKVPGNVMLPVVGMKGQLRAEALWRFGEGEQRPMEIVGRTAELFLETKVDGVLHDTSWKGGGRPSVGVFLGSSMTDLPLLDRVRLALFVVGLRDDQWLEKEIPLRLGEIEKLPDGSEVVVVDQERLVAVRHDLVSERLLMSQLRVVIEDGTGVSGAAKLAEGMIQTAGGLVSELGKVEQMEGNCLLTVTKSNRRDVLVDWLKERLFCRISEEGGQELEVVVRLGRDWGERYSRE